MGRPDIEVNFLNYSILIECKIEAIERYDQLEDYASILLESKEAENKIILYITKYFEVKEIKKIGVKLQLLRWFDIYNVITVENQEITQQFKNFLKEKNMEGVKNFSIADLNAMKTFPSAKSKMDELLEQYKLEFEKRFKNYSRDYSRASFLKDSYYANYATFMYKKLEYTLYIGFFWHWEVESPYVGLTVEIPSKAFEKTDLVTIMAKHFKSWEMEETETLTCFSAVVPITTFIASEDDHVPAMKKFIDSKLVQVYDLQKKKPDLFAKKSG